MLSLRQLSHITLICKDIDKTGKFFKKIFGAVEHYATKENVYSIAREKFFKIGNVWVVVMEGEPITPTYNHIAFQVAASDLSWLCQEIEKLGLNILKGRKRKTEEGESIYFYDYDNHLFELHCGSLAERIKYYRGCDDSERS